MPTDPSSRTQGPWELGRRNSSTGRLARPIETKKKAAAMKDAWHENVGRQYSGMSFVTDRMLSHKFLHFHVLPDLWLVPQILAQERLEKSRVKWH